MKRVKVNNIVIIMMMINITKDIFLKFKRKIERTNNVAHSPINTVKIRMPQNGKKALRNTPINNHKTIQKKILFFFFKSSIFNLYYVFCVLIIKI